MSRSSSPSSKCHNATEAISNPIQSISNLKPFCRHLQVDKVTAQENVRHEVLYGKDMFVPRTLSVTKKKVKDNIAERTAKFSKVLAKTRQDGEEEQVGLNKTRVDDWQFRQKSVQVEAERTFAAQKEFGEDGHKRMRAEGNCRDEAEDKRVVKRSGKGMERWLNNGDELNKTKTKALKTEGTLPFQRISGEDENILDKAESGSRDEEEDDKVLERSEEQRWPNPDEDEPVCVICGRYGEYICDRTEQDVCSIECKMKNLQRSINQRLEVKNKFGRQDKTMEAEGDKNINDIKEASCSLDENQSSPGLGNAIDAESFHQFFNDRYNYKSHWTIPNLTQEKIEFLRNKLEIKVQGEDLVSPVLEFSHCRFAKKLNDNLKENNYISPTPIQMQAIPIALSKRDMLACAQTGTGKSASFLLPMITRISAATETLSSNHHCCIVPLALILGPTRELCMQIEDQAKLFSRGLSNLKTALLIGGCPLPQQLHRLGQKVQIIIATPGRLNEILEKHEEICDLRFVQIVVLDEVDTMLQMGFQAQVDKILQHIPASSQKLMFSATIPASIEKIASKLLQNPVFISVGPPSAPNKSVKQIILWVEETSKKKRLFDLINDRRHFLPPVVVFVDSKLGADMLANAVTKVCNIPCASLHGDKLQQERTQILQDFLNGSYQALVSTSVLGRGIDLLNVRMVINFDMPSSVQEYVHQVGRAGRLDLTGFAITFINNNNKDVFLNLVELLEDCDVKVPLELINSPYLQQQKERRERKGKGPKRQHELVTTGNLMDMLKTFTGKRKR